MLTGIPRETQVYLTQHGLFSLAGSMTADQESIAVPTSLSSTKSHLCNGFEQLGCSDSEQLGCSGSEQRGCSHLEVS